MTRVVVTGAPAASSPGMRVRGEGGFPREASNHWASPSTRTLDVAHDGILESYR